MTEQKLIDYEATHGELPEEIAEARAERSHPADDGEPITTEWLHTLPGRVIDKTSVDSVLIEIGIGKYIVVEADFSVAIQDGMYDAKDSQYIPLPADYKTRGQLRRLMTALGIPCHAGK